MAGGEQNLIDLVNARLDALRLVQAIDFHVDKLRVIGRNIKTPCMIHRDERFATLIVDPNRRHFTCMVADCPGRDGGDLVRLYGLWSGTEGIAAALGAARTGGVELEQGIVEGALADLESAAAAAEAREDWGAALPLLAQLAELRADDPTRIRALKAFRAEIDRAVAEGDGDAASELAARARALIGEGATATAMGLLAELAGETAQDFGSRVDALLRSPEAFAFPALDALLSLLCHPRMASTEAAAVGLQQAIETAIVSRDSDLATAAIGPFAACSLTSPGDLVRAARQLAELGAAVPEGILVDAFSRHLAAVPKVSSEQVLELAALAIDRTEDAGLRLNIATAAAELAAGEGRDADAERFLEIAISAGGDRVESLARVAEMRAKAGRAKEAAKILAEAAGAAIAAGSAERALELYARLFELAPADFDAADRYLELLADDTGRLAGECLAFARRALSERNPSKAIAYARRAATALPGDSEVALKAAEALYDAHAPAEATAVVVEAAATIETTKGIEDAAALVAWAIERHPGAAELHLLLGRLRARAGRVAQALREFAEAAAIEEEAGNLSAADGIHGEAVALTPGNPEVLQERVDFLRRHRPELESAFADALDALASCAAQAGDGGRARLAAEELLALQPESESTMELLVDLCESAGDESEAADHALALAALRERKGLREQALEAAMRARALTGETRGVLERLVACGPDVADKEAWAGWARKLMAVHADDGRSAEAAALARELMRRRLAADDDYAGLVALLRDGGDADEAAAAALEGARSALDAGHRRPAVELLLATEACKPQSASLLHEAGLLWIRADDARRGAQMLCRAAIALAQSRRDDDARSCLEEARIAGGLAPDATILYADLLHRAGETREAVRHLREARTKGLMDAGERATLLGKLVELDPSDAAAQEELAKALANANRRDEAAQLHLDLARRRARDADWHEALPHAIAARDLRPDDTAVRIMLAETQSGLGNDAVALREYAVVVDRMLAQKRFDEAQEIIESCLAIDPESDEMLGRSVDCLAASGQIEDAVESALEIAERAEAKGDPAAALRWIGRAAALDPENEDLALRRANALDALGDKGQALELRLAPLRARTDQGLVEDAVKWLDEFVETAADEVAVREAAARVFEQAQIPELAAAQWLAVARIHRDAGRGEAALAAAVHAARLNPRGLEAREIAAKTLVELGREFESVPMLEEMARLLADAFAGERAADVYREILKIDPNRIEAREGLAECLLRLGRREEAADLLRELGQRHEEAGRVEESLAAMRRLLELRPDDTSARRRLIGEFSRTGEMPDLSQQYLLLAGTHERQGRLEDALEALAQGLAKRPESIDLLERRLRLAQAAKNSVAAVESAVSLARVHLAAGRPADAAKVLEQAKSEGNRMGDWHAAMAETWRARNSSGAALREHEEAAALYELEQNLERKAATLARIVELDPQRLDARKERADLLRRMGRMEEASNERMELGDLYASRSLFDLAVAEYRAVTESSPRELSAWKALFDNRLKYGTEADLVADYLRFARILAETGEEQEALDWIGRAIRADPRSIPAREAYIEVYMKSGEEADLVEDYLALADLLVAAGQVDRGIALYSKVMALNPAHGKARDRLTETRARAKGQPVPTPDLASLPTERPHETRWARLKNRQEARKEENVDTVDDDTAAAKRATGTNRAVAAKLLADEMDFLDEKENEDALSEVLRSYESILQINPLNAGVRIKAAGLLQQLGRTDEALAHLEKASEAFFDKSELNACIDACEHILRLRPTDQKARIRLRQALNKRDAFKALESEILFSDMRNTDDTESGRLFPKRKRE